MARPPAKFLADLNISPLSVATLQQHGWDVVRVTERLPAQASDEEILELARREGRTILTQDLDFSSLVALQGLDQPSLVTLRLANPDPERIARSLLDLASVPVPLFEEGYAVTIEESSIRIRKLPIRREL
jgi:predicted nuclease of predicted toxin-antitoxin system